MSQDNPTTPPDVTVTTELSVSASDEVLSDIALPVEELQITINNDVSASKFDSPDFLKSVLSRLYCARVKSMKWLALSAIAKCMKVDAQEFDKWGQEQPRLERRIGKGGDKIVYYGLSKLDSIKIGDERFTQALVMVLTEDKKNWKSLSYIANKLQVDEKELGDLLPKYSGLLRKVGDGGKVFYGMQDRVLASQTLEESKKGKSKGKAKKGSLHIDNGTTIEAIMALSMLHPTCDTLLRVMNFYGNRLAVRHSDAYAFLARAQKELSNGVAILMKDLEVKDRQMPDLERV